MAETPLLVAMHEYRGQLDRHLVALRERHQHLQTAWLRLRESYEGEGGYLSQTGLIISLSGGRGSDRSGGAGVISIVVLDPGRLRRRGDRSAGS